MGKSTISMAIFKFAMWLFTRPGSLWSNFGVQKVSEDSFCHRPIILSMLVFLLSPGIVLVDGCVSLCLMLKSRGFWADAENQNIYPHPKVANLGYPAKEKTLDMPT